MSDRQLIALSVFWCMVCILITLVVSMRRQRSVGLTGAFLMTFSANYVLGGALYLLPWQSLYPPRIIALGIQQAAIGIGGFMVGSLLLAWRLSNRDRQRVETAPDTQTRTPEPNPQHATDLIGQEQYRKRLALATAVVGVSCYFLPTALDRSTSSTIINVLSNLSLAAACLWIYGLAMQRKRYAWPATLLVAAIFPTASLLQNGFLSYGVVMSVMVIMFYFSLGGFGVRQFLVMLVLGYFALSLFTAYMGVRNEIRSSVWGGESYSRRTSSAYMIIQEFSPLSLQDSTQLGHVDDRLQGSYLVGLAVFNLRNRIVSPANGATVLDIFTAIVPRAIWPGKPAIAGGSTMMTKYTGVIFSDQISVGFGPVLEGYVNFGSYGVFVLFLIYGLFIAFIDKRSRVSVDRGDYSRFVIFLISGIALVDPSELIATSVAGFLSAYLLLSGIRFAVGIVHRNPNRRAVFRRSANKVF